MPSEQKYMDPNQEEDLKKLSFRTEELLSRLNDLSNSLNLQIKSQTPQIILPQNQNTDSPPQTEIITTIPEISAEIKPNYYSMPLNTHYLEKKEKSIKTTGSGQQFLTTSSTSIFTEVHSPETENFIPANNNFTPLNNNFHSINNNSNPIVNLSNHATQEAFQYKPQTEQINYSQNQQKQSFYNPIIPTPPPRTPEEPQNNFQQALQPSAVFSTDQAPTRRAPINGRTQEIADQIAAQNKEIKDRLQKYSKRVQISSNGDILRLFALAAPFFALVASMGIVNALEITEFAKASAIYCIGLFLGIFLSAIALRIVEISELVRWAHNQILFIKSDKEEK